MGETSTHVGIICLFNSFKWFQIWHFNFKACCTAGMFLSASVSIAAALLWQAPGKSSFVRSNAQSIDDLRESTAGDPTRALRGWTPGLRACKAPVQQRPTAPNIVKMAEGGKRRRNLRLYIEPALRRTAPACNVKGLYWACAAPQCVQLPFCPPQSWLLNDRVQNQNLLNIWNSNKIRGSIKEKAN